MPTLLHQGLAYAEAVPRPHFPHPDPIVARVFETPVGPMLGAAVGSGVCLLEFGDRPALRDEVPEVARLLSRPFVACDEAAAAGSPGLAHLATLERELAAYFAGERHDFSVPLETPGTEFERRVWAALRQIPYGQTTSYGRLAFKLGVPGGARAVGRANGRNRIAIVIPCHRVVNEGGGLGGYGGGLKRKEFLLELERLEAEQMRLFA